MRGTALLLVGILAPLLSAVAVMTVRPAGLRAGRFVAVGCGVGFLASAAVVSISAARRDGLVGTGEVLGLHADRASALLLAAVTATGAVVASFARRNIDLDPAAGRFFALLGALVTGSGLVVVPGGALALVLGWVGSTWALVGLVGHRAELPATRMAQRRTALALVVGDVALLLAVGVMVVLGGSDVSRNVTAAAAGLGSATVFGADAATVVAVLLVVAGASRSALVPFHRWLVATLAAPTPVSALVHAGFVSGAGLLLIRFGPVTLQSFAAMHLAFALAILTIIVGVGSGATRVDVKGKLAWSTVSQMGFMVAQVAVGAVSSAVLHIIGHGMYKASMFLGAGDVISSRLRSSRRSLPLPVAPAHVRLALSVVVAVITLGTGLWILPPRLPVAGVVLVAVFAGATVAHGVWGWLARGAMRPLSAVVVAALGAFAAVFTYLGGLRLMEAFLAPSSGLVVLTSGVSTVSLLVTLGVVAAGVGVVTLAKRLRGGTMRTRLDVAFEHTAHPALSAFRGRRISHTADVRRPAIASQVDASHATDARSLDQHVGEPAELNRSQIRADVARAATIIAPSWPLTSFVAVNPLGGLERRGFDDATATARRFLRARTHLSLEDFRRDHADGVTTLDDLTWAIEAHFPDVCALPPIERDGHHLAAADIVLLDMLHGPDLPPSPVPLTTLERAEGLANTLSEMIDASVCHSAAQYVARDGSAPGGERSFHSRWRVDAMRVAGLRRTLSRDARRWLQELGDDPADIIAAAFAVTGVDAATRVDELRGHLARVQGWAGYSKWRTDWADSRERRPLLRPIDIVAARAALEAACLLGGTPFSGLPPAPSSSESVQAPRVDAILAALRVEGGDDIGSGIADVVSRVDPFARNAAWLRAQERAADRRLLGALDRHERLGTEREPDAQLVFCIDVRSEGLRRHLEAIGPYDTLGFAGFFGVAMAVQRLEWDHVETRCPVLVTPSARAIERPVDTSAGRRSVARFLSQDRLFAGVDEVHAATKSGAGAPFAMAEAAGWLAGPVAAARTLLPHRPSRPRRPPTAMELDTSPGTGFDTEQRVFAAEAVLRTMSLTAGMAPLVVLCGHGSANVNNPHATALDCGACAGASGQDNARAVAALLNAADVRVGLRDRGIDIPDGTHFAAALHDTVSDAVTIVDTHLVPPHLHAILERLVADLDVAARRQSAERARQLPGRPASVRSRGADWAQVRPEWGLARNASFIVGPRSMTTGLDLEGRSFLHTYEADQDPDGKVLETIMTAPLVVAHWISSQYYFSTVDPEAFGAGDKLVHNIVADTGVVSGEGGDIRVGLPLQSTHCGSRRHHQPIRLLAVIQAPLERIERIIDDNPILTTLIGGSWIRVAGRSHPHEPWSIRTPKGTWNAEPRGEQPINTLETP